MFLLILRSVFIAPMLSIEVEGMQHAENEPMAVPCMSLMLMSPVCNLLPLCTMTNISSVAPPGEYVGNL